VLYTNLLAVLPMFLLGWGMGDFARFSGEGSTPIDWSVPAITMLAASSVVRPLMKTTSPSATSDEPDLKYFKSCWAGAWAISRAFRPWCVRQQHGTGPPRPRPEEDQPSFSV
jgi:hypothetical protein